MKRNENIIPISRDHHFGLLTCWKIKEGLKKDVAYSRIQDYINYSWQHDLKTHFAEEEQVLFIHSTDQYTQKAIEEHRDIEKMIELINQSIDTSLLTDLADLLQKHIRFEEQILFPFLEDALSEATLQQVGKVLWGTHQPKEDNYEDEFWK